MKVKTLTENMQIVCTKKVKETGASLDFYLVSDRRGKLYAYKRRYSDTGYSADEAMGDEK